ncbi:DUF1003 domain-containing protein [Noviherbaspirillum pedocola]|uniref:DUF1003 domain-containing protein n=1 Tax=Noviherbaspirillum pedocola TaxID=2801341 RepID=A0A934W7L3_9BURK|nr:DUF1003 domain-containing protein [Noviherbaspirillum pedocola]MBK4737577.1 DUF1003 domain-containing protein [Noviherbaspirillum pedocola]
MKPDGILNMESQERVGKNEQQGVSDAIQSNLEKVEEFQRREDAKRSDVQKLIERASIFFSSPRFLVMFLSTTVAWICGNVVWHYSGHPYFDEPPFFMLQGVVSYIGVLITMAVLVRQNRMAQVEESRAHLELQVNLLAEQKATKIIMLLEELRRDMPDVHNRHDAHAKTLQAMTNPDDVLAEIESRHVVSGDKRDEDATGRHSAR